MDELLLSFEFSSSFCIAVSPLSLHLFVSVSWYEPLPELCTTVHLFVADIRKTLIMAFFQVKEAPISAL